MHNYQRLFVAALALTIALQASGLAQAPGKSSRSSFRRKRSLYRHDEGR